MHVEKVTDEIGFAAANIDFKGPDGWRIVQSQWSYGLPIPNVK